MAKFIDPDKLPLYTRNIMRIITKSTDGNITKFANQMGMENSTRVQRIFQPDKRSGKYPVPSTELLMMIHDVYGISVDDILFTEIDPQSILSSSKQENQQKTVNNINIVTGNNNNTSITSGK